MFLSRAYKKPAALNATHPAASAIRKLPPDFMRIILAFAFLPIVCGAEEPPPDLARKVARRESETQAARNQYTYRQSVTVEELNTRGGKAGEYREVRDVIFSPERERIDQLIGKPVKTLQHLILTEEDFRDIREIQPFVLVEETLFVYETKFRGEEEVDGEDCYVLQVRPRQILQGQRLFEGLLWVRKTDYSTVRTEGQAVPQIRSMKQENLFPRFTTIRHPVDGRHWFPAYTHADDTLHFRTGPQRIRLMIRYSQYKKFGSESSITFER